MTPNELDELYESWFTSQCPLLYDKLLQAIIDITFLRFRREGQEAAESISMMLAAKVFRALPGYLGPQPLKPFDPTRSRFSGFVSTMGRTTRLDYRRTLAKQRHVVYSGNIEGLDAQKQGIKKQKRK